MKPVEVQHPVSRAIPGTTVSWMLPIQHQDYNRMSASIWIRCFQLLPELNSLGISNLVNHTSDESQISVFVRNQSDGAFDLARKHRDSGKKIVFDLCVNYFDETGLFEGGYGTTQERVDEAARMLTVADSVTCASDNIAQRARQFHPNVVCLPDAVDMSHFRFRKSLDDFARPDLRMVWCGSSSKIREMSALLPLFVKHRLKLVIISNRQVDLEYRGRFGTRKFDYEFHRWTYESFPADILRGDIAFSYRDLSTPYNHGHSSFKIAVFLAQGVPVLASPVPSYQSLLNHGGGRICDSLDEWDTALGNLCAQRQPLQQWSEEARSTTLELEKTKIAGRYASTFSDLIGIGE